MSTAYPPLGNYSTVDHAVRGLHLEANEHHESIFNLEAEPGTGNLHRYPDSKCTYLADSLAVFLRILPSQLFFTNGSIEAIDEILARAFRRGLTTAGIIEPSYALYGPLVLRNGLDSRIANLNPDDAFRQSYTWENYAAALGTTDLCILGSPNNPTGTLLDPSAMAKILSQYSGDLVMDEAYIEYVGYRESLGRYTINNPRLLIVRTFSKAWGLAAIRLGYVIGHPDVISDLKDASRPYRVPGLTQKVAIGALSNSSAMIESARRNNQLRARMTKSLCQFQGITVFETKANFVLLAYKEASSLWRFLRNHEIFVKLLESAGCMLRIAVPSESGLTRLVVTMRAFFEDTPAGFA